jgi:hypothetical protein
MELGEYVGARGSPQWRVWLSSDGNLVGAARTHPLRARCSATKTAIVWILRGEYRG